MGEPNAALGVYMNDPARIRSVLEYYLGEKLPEDWKYEELKGLKYVLGIMKCTKSSKKYETYIRENWEYFSRIPKSALDRIQRKAEKKGKRQGIQQMI